MIIYFMLLLSSMLLMNISLWIYIIFLTVAKFKINFINKIDIVVVVEITGYRIFSHSLQLI